MNPMISVEIDTDAAKIILKLLEMQPMPPLDEEDMALYILANAVRDALETDDSDDTD